MDDDEEKAFSGQRTRCDVEHNVDETHAASPMADPLVQLPAAEAEQTTEVEAVETAEINEDLESSEMNETRPFIDTDGERNRQTNDANLSGSFASFRDEVYSPTTVANKNQQSENNVLKACCSRCYKACRPIMWKYNNKPTSGDSRLTKLKYSLMCPPRGLFAYVLVMLFILMLGFGLIWSITGDEGLPGGTFFGLYVLFVLCVLSGYLVTFIKLPPLLGMLLMGCLLGNVPYINVARFIDPGWSSSLRKVALAVILTRAGLGLDPHALRRMSFVVVRLAFIPCLVEALCCMITSNLILGLPWVWGLMLGFVLAAVSPAVVVPSLLSLSERGFGVDQGIPTLVIAAASIDDVLAISAFSICLGIAFTNTSNLALTVVKGPLEAVGGVVYGIVVGIVLWYLPTNIKTAQLDIKRSGLLLAAGIFALFGSSAAGIDGAGALGCLTLPFVAALRWRTELAPGLDKLPTEIHMGYLWTFFQPLLFGLIGAAVDLSKVDGRLIGLGISVLLIGLVFRLLASFLAVFGAGFTWKERFFIPLAWLPKATVQALIGSVAYDTAIQKNSSENDKVWGMQILTIAVLCIMITAPIGAAAISLSGPRLLQKTTRNNKDTAGAATNKQEQDKNGAISDEREASV